MDEIQQSAELRQAFLRHLPKRLDGVRRRGRRLCNVGWDINALALLYDELQLLAGSCGSHGLIDLSEKLYAVERALTPHMEPVALPDPDATRQILQTLDSLGPAAHAPTGSGLGANLGASADERVTLDGIPLQVTPPPEFIARHARPVNDLPAEPTLLDANPGADTAMPFEALEPTPALAATAGLPTDPIALPPARIVAAVAPPTTGVGRHVFHLSDGNPLATELDQRLEAEGYQLEIVERADELKEMLRALAANLVILDAAFLDDIESIGQAVRTARTRTNQRIALMVMSASTDVAVRLRAMRAGADSFIPLPAAASDLRTRIQELVEAETAEPYRVMIIEDDRAQALFAESILRKAGMQTVAVMDPLSALDTLEQFEPELILMDLYMPNCDGMELTTLIRERERFVNTPIVFLSGEHDTDKRFDALSAGGDDYLEKPIRPKYLISAVTNRVRRARAVNRRVQSHSPRDAATGLYERNYLIDRIAETLAGDDNGTNLGGALFLIIDGAQAIRERIGLSAFDALIGQGGALLAGLIGGTDFAARYGDSSFLALCPGRAEQELARFGEEIRARFDQQLFEVGDKSLALGVSIGIATYAHGWPDAGAMLNAAERAAAQARGSSERKVRVHAEVETAAVQNEADTLLGSIRDAVRHDRFQLLFQPIASLRGASEEQFHVLLRMRDGGGRVLNAAELVPIAEKHGLIGDIDRWVLARCAMVVQERDRLDRPVRLFASQSVSSFDDPQRLGWLRQQLEARHVGADQVVLEFRFADVVPRLRQAIGFCQEARQSGLHICLAGFEASMAAYQVLQHLPADYLKVGAKYVGPQAEQREVRAELRQIVAHAHEHKVRVIAPLVEDAKTAAGLWSAGIDYIQGNFVQQAGQDLDFEFRTAST
jgi:diguanylate cyclase (GGDEF)-like protein